MLQWFVRFPKFTEITEFNESSVPFRKNTNKSFIQLKAGRKYTKNVKYLIYSVSLDIDFII